MELSFEEKENIKNEYVDKLLAVINQSSETYFNNKPMKDFMQITLTVFVIFGSTLLSSFLVRYIPEHFRDDIINTIIEDMIRLTHHKISEEALKKKLQ